MVLEWEAATVESRLQVSTSWQNRTDIKRNSRPSDKKLTEAMRYIRAIKLPIQNPILYGPYIGDILTIYWAIYGEKHRDYRI